MISIQRLNRLLPPSFLGSLIAMLVSSVYIVLESERFFLWSDLIKVVILGAPTLVLITYALSWYLYEQLPNSTIARRKNAEVHEYWTKLLAHTFLFLALASLGVDFSMYLVFFTLFVIAGFATCLFAHEICKHLILQELVNFTLCTIFIGFAWKMNVKAIEFNQNYGVMVTDPASYDVYLKYSRGDLMDLFMTMGLVVGFMLLNLFLLISRRPKPTSIPG